MGPVSTRTCGPNLVAVRRSCRKKGGGVQTDRQADRQTKISAALYSRLMQHNEISNMKNIIFSAKFTLTRLGVTLVNLRGREHKLPRYFLAYV